LDWLLYYYCLTAWVCLLSQAVGVNLPTLVFLYGSITSEVTLARSVENEFSFNYLSNSLKVSGISSSSWIFILGIIGTLGYAFGGANLFDYSLLAV
jgi:hypothetical protein